MQRCRHKGSGNGWQIHRRRANTVCVCVCVRQRTSGQSREELIVHVTQLATQQALRLVAVAHSDEVDGPLHQKYNLRAVLRPDTDTRCTHELISHNKLPTDMLRRTLSPPATTHLITSESEPSATATSVLRMPITLDNFDSSP